MKFEINFKADLTPEKEALLDLCFADTLKRMGIEPEDLTITLREKPDPIPAVAIEEPTRSLSELLNMPMKHINDVQRCFEACKSKSDINKVIEAAPTYFGRFWPSYSEHSIVILNNYFDGEEDYEEEYWFDYPEDWEDEDEE